MDLSSEQMDDLRDLASSRHVSADVALRARIVLWSADWPRRKDIAGALDAVEELPERVLPHDGTHQLATLGNRLLTSGDSELHLEY